LHHTGTGGAAGMRPNGGGEFAGGCGEESMLTNGLSAKGVRKWAHIGWNHNTSREAKNVQKNVEHFSLQLRCG